MEDYKTERDYCIKIGYHPNDKQDQGELSKMFFEFKQHLIDTGEMVPAEKWISVKDRLPLKEQTCLVVENGLISLAFHQWLDEEVEYAFVHPDYNYDNDAETGFDQIAITHWMPVPSAPAEHNTKECKRCKKLHSCQAALCEECEIHLDNFNS